MPWHYRCKNMHGHSWSLVVVCEGKIDERGVVVDFDHLDRVVAGLVVDRLDHRNLNDIVCMPTCENIAQWALDQFNGPEPGPGFNFDHSLVKAIAVQEGPTGGKAWALRKEKGVFL